MGYDMRRVAIILYFTIFVGITVAAGVFFWRARLEYNRLQGIEDENRRQLVQLEFQLRKQEKMLERLHTDPAYVEKVIRQRLGYAKPGEYVFRFEE